MTDREQLLELREAIDGMSANYRNRLGFCPLELINRLLARWPYEPGEWIYVGDTEIEADRREIKKRFLAAFDKWVICDDGPPVSPREDATAELWLYHRPIPKFRTLEVPEEIIQLAQLARNDYVGHPNAQKNNRMARTGGGEG